MKTTWSRLAVGAFEHCFRPWMHGRFSRILVDGLPDSLPADRAVVFAANHVSWWDGFFIREIHRVCCPGRPLITLMHERELKRLPYFRLMGVIGLKSELRSVRQAMRQLSAFNDRSSIGVTIFPQGQIWPVHRRPLGFQNGIEVLVRSILPAVVIPVSIHIEPLAAPGPTVFMRIGTPSLVDTNPSALAGDVEQEVERNLDVILSMLAQYGERAPERFIGQSERAVSIAGVTHSLRTGRDIRPVLTR